MARSGRHQRSASEAGQASPPKMMRRKLGTSRDSMASSVGTVSSTVMPSAFIRSGRRSASPSISAEATNRVAPTRYGIQISSIDRSNATEAPWNTTSVPSMW